MSERGRKDSQKKGDPRGEAQGKGGVLEVQEVSASEVGGVYGAECLTEVKGHQDMDLAKRRPLPTLARAASVE